MSHASVMAQSALRQQQPTTHAFAKPASAVREEYSRTNLVLQMIERRAAEIVSSAQLEIQGGVPESAVNLNLIRSWNTCGANFASVLSVPENSEGGMKLEGGMKFEGGSKLAQQGPTKKLKLQLEDASVKEQFSPEQQWAALRVEDRALLMRATRTLLVRKERWAVSKPSKKMKKDLLAYLPATATAVEKKAKAVLVSSKLLSDLEPGLCYLVRYIMHSLFGKSLLARKPGASAEIPDVAPAKRSREEWELATLEKVSGKRKLAGGKVVAVVDDASDEEPVAPLVLPSAPPPEANRDGETPAQKLVREYWQPVIQIQDFFNYWAHQKNVELSHTARYYISQIRRNASKWQASREASAAGSLQEVE
jgi:hypothetical protein